MKYLTSERIVVTDSDTNFNQLFANLKEAKKLGVLSDIDQIKNVMFVVMEPCELSKLRQDIADPANRPLCLVN